MPNPGIAVTLSEWGSALPEVLLRSCENDGCTKPYAIRGLCYTHYRETGGANWGRWENSQRNVRESGVDEPTVDLRTPEDDVEASVTDEWAVLKRARALGLDLLVVLTRLRAWDGCCEGCRIPETELLKSISLDHNHATGAFRGFLCQPCNLTLGHARDDVKRLTLLTDYLNRNP